MAHTPLLQRVQSLIACVAESERRGVDPEQILEERSRQPLSRRDLLAGAAALAVLPPRRVVSRSTLRVAVVGGGLAGLTCAYRLKQSGVYATVYEAAGRVGGRCWSLRNAFNEGQVVEQGGELIDQGHTAIRRLAQELDLPLDNLLMEETNGTELFGHFLGQPYSYTQATRDLKAIWQKIHSDVSAASYPTLYNNYTSRGLQLDRMSIIDWINESVPGGLNTQLGRLLDVAYNIEYGGECNVQSSLNLLYLMGYSGQGQLRLFGPSNEKYHVRGGNDQIAARMAAQLSGQIETGRALVAVRQTAAGGYTLTFRSGQSVQDVSVDKVVLALPFSLLRGSVDLSQAGFNALKQLAIAEQGMGTNAKFHLQFTERYWDRLGCNGDTFSDLGYQNTWHVTRGQPGVGGVLNNYTGGNVGASYGGVSTSRLANQVLDKLDVVLPGIKSRWNGKATLHHWPSHPWTRGSYSYWKVGQYTRFAGAEGERSGNCHFCGEHTSIDFQGYLNGAVETGERVYNEILAEVR